LAQQVQPKLETLVKAMIAFTQTAQPNKTVTD
jgi:hypothetical protein